MPKPTRKPGQEIQAAKWLARHPGITATPVTLGASMAELGTMTTGGMAAGVLCAGLGWYRAHPSTFDRYAGPRLRAFRRRWTRYIGRNWTNILTDCDLVTVNRRTGETQVPRLIRVRSATPTIDTLYVRLLRGQSLRSYLDRSDILTTALNAEAIAIARVKPQVVAITVVRSNPFTEEVPAVEIPGELSDVDLNRVEFGDNEYGNAWTESIVGQHILGSGATGSGKTGLMYNPLRSIGPAIRDGLVKVNMIDLKGGMETARMRGLCYRYATDSASAMTLIETVRDEMVTEQAQMRDQGKRKFTPSVETPLNLLIIDEIAMLTALGEHGNNKTANKILTQILTQGRASGHCLWAFVQEPTKDVLPIRDLFTVRVTLRANTASQPDMVLGDGARERGALADEIPATDDHAGIGFRVDERSRNPIRIRTGHVTDADLDELVDQCAPGTSALDAEVIELYRDQQEPAS